MSAAATVLLCSEPQSSQWQVGSPRRGRLLLIGWTSLLPTTDAGMPPWMRETLARTLTRSHRVTFPSTVVSEGDAETSIPLAVGGLWRRLASREPRGFSLITTQRASVVTQAFDDPGFPWWMQGQTLLMSSVDRPAPALSGDDVLRLIDSPENSVELLKAHDLTAQLCAGVDGDVAALITIGESTRSAFTKTLHDVAAEMGMEAHWLEESEFAKRLTPP